MFTSKPNSQLPKGALRRSPEIKLTKSFRKSEEGRREYGADHCDAELARLHQLTDDIQAGTA